MFENLIQGNDERSPTEALLELLNVDEAMNRTFLEMPNLRITLIKYRRYLRFKHPNKHPIEIDYLVIERYYLLMESLQGKRSVQIVEGIKEMKPALIEGSIQEQLMKK